MISLKVTVVLTDWADFVYCLSSIGDGLLPMELTHLVTFVLSFSPPPSPLPLYLFLVAARLKLFTSLFKIPGKFVKQTLKATKFPKS